MSSLPRKLSYFYLPAAFYLLELIPVGEIASCSVRVEGSGGGELTVTVRGPRGEVPVRLTGDAASGLVASFTPKNVGPHTLTAHYNNQPVPVSKFLLFIKIILVYNVQSVLIHCETYSI